MFQRTFATAGGTTAAQIRARLPAIEWPTILLALALYGGWLAITWFHASLPAWVSYPLTAILLCGHSSMQHEILHGHPTRWRSVNRLLGMIPLSLWIPYERYRQTHLQHHIDERLTDPYDDPESHYWTPQDWARLAPPLRALVWAQTTLAGRVIIGPFWAISRFWLDEAQRVIANAPGARMIWLEHLLWCIPVVAWVTLVCGIPLWAYALGMVIPGTGILLIRSFAEHRACEGVRERTAIVENSWLLGPLFLFNNLHSLHHEQPMIPWYRYPAWYRENRDRLIAENGGHLYNSYIDVARRYLFTPHRAPPHPLGRAPRGA